MQPLLSHLERGRGTPLVLVHAFPLDHTMWFPQFDAFDAHYRVVAPDIRGFGKSKPPAPWTMEGMGEELRELLDALAIDRCTLVGLSMGGYVALPFTAKYPGRVERLVLAHTRARADTEEEKQNRSRMIAAIERDGIQPLVDTMPARLLKPNPAADILARIRGAIAGTDPVAAIHGVTALRDRKDSVPLLGQIQCPTLVLAGAQDAIIPAEDSKGIAAALPRGQFAVIPDAGHLGNIENPAAFNHELNTFLEK